MNLQEAIDAPAWHSEHFPSSFLAAQGPSRRHGGWKSRVPEGHGEGNCARAGHQVEVGPDWSEGRLTAASKIRPPPPAPPPIPAACRAMRPDDSFRR